ncbi:serine-rich adhesin for platelets isoform X3 [Folsomia candida]|uniref:serine-rich adhesin for platelets isoform X3 n=1 Tax=Folsomia candida TaxID=158441 RepID=UPI001604FD93|nr:serine-rich adhesin for platelets isoform X3 [Folsomia candida]
MESCFNAGDITGAVIGTFVATLILMGIIWLVYTKMKKRKAKKSGMMDLVIVEEGRGDKDADKPSIYDNPGFVDDSMDPKKSGQQSGNDVKMNGSKKPMSSEDGGKKVPWGPFRFLFKSRSALDDSVMEEPQKYSVALRGHDFTGLGFNICGNMKEGIYVKDVMQRGPAAESKHILPGDQITSMTVSFQQMVLEDAVTLLSYASPYEVSLEMMRHPEKSLHHKGLFVSPVTHPSSSGQSGTLERVCHPFFKSQSIDDLRKVGKEHLDQQVSRSKKQTNGMKLSSSSSTTMEVPTVVVGSNEARSQKSSSQSPNANLGLGAGKLGLKAHHPKQISVDEVDSARGPIFPEIKVSAKMSKPEIIPRAKSKVTNVKKDAPPDAAVAPPAASVVVVEAISPVVKMSADFEKMVEEHSISQQTNSADFGIKGPKSAAVIEVEPMEVVLPELQAPNMQDKIPSMMMLSGESSDLRKQEVKGPHVEIEMMAPELAMGMQEESSVKKPQRGQKGKDKADKNKEKEAKKEKASKEMKGDGEQQSPEKSKFSKFGFNLPDISLNFGKSNKSGEEKEKENKDVGVYEEVDEVVVVEMTKEESKQQKPDKEKKDKSSKSKDKEKKEMSSSSSKGKKEDANENEPVTTTFTSESSSSYHHEEMVGEKKPLEKSSSSGFGFHLKFPSFDKPILKRKDSSGSNSGEKEGEMMVDKDPGAKPESPSKPAKATKIKKESKTKEDKSRPTSPASRESDDSTENNETMTMKPSADPSDSAETEKSSSPKKGGGGFHMPHLGIKLPKFGHSKQTYSFENAGDGSAKESKQSEIPKNIEESSSSSVKVELTADAPDFSKSAKSVDDAAMKIQSSEMSISKSKKPPPSASSSEVEAASLPSMEARPSSPIGVSYGLYPPSVESEIKDKEAMSLGRSRSPTPLGDRGTRDKTMKSEEDLTEKDGKGEKSGESKPGIVSKVLRDLKEKVSGKRSHDGQHQQQQHSGAHNNGSSSEDEADAEEQGKEVKAAKEKVKLDKKAAKEAKEKAAAEAKKEKERLKAEKKVKKAELKAKKQAATSGQSSDSSSSSSDESDAQDKDKKVKKDKKKSKSAKLKDKEKKSGKTKATASSPPPVETIEIETETFEEVASMSQQQQNSDTQMEQMVKSGGDDKPPVAPRKSKESAKAKEKALTTEESTKSTKDKKPKKEKSEKKPKSKDKKGKKDDSSSTSSSSSSSDSEDESSGKPKKPKRSAKRKAPVPPTSTTTTTTVTETVHETMTYAADAATSADVQLNESYSKTPESGRRSASFGDLSSLQPKLKMDNMDRTMSLDMAAENEQMSTTSSTMPVAGPVDDLSADPDSKVIIPHFTRSSQQPNLTTRLEETSSSSSSETLRAAATAATSVVHVHPKESSVTVVTHTTNDIPPVSDDLPSGLTYGLTPTTTTIQQINVGSSDPSSTIQQPQHGASEIQRMMDDTISMMNSIAHKMDSPSLVHSVLEKEHQSGGVTFSTVQSQPAPATSSTMTISSSSSDAMTKDEAEMLAQQTVDDIIAHVNKNGGTQVHANGGGTGGHESMASIGGLGARSMESSSNTVRNVTVTSIHQSMTAKDDQHHHMVEGDDSASSATNKASVLRGDSKSRLMQTDPEPSTSSSNDDDDMPYNRNGALSPSTYKMETEYKYATSEMMVTSSPIPSGEHSPTTTTVYSTTMTLPQKTVTQITLGEPTVDSHGRIVSKITLESSPTSADTTNEESDLPTLKPTK